jgi:thioredoxin reductase
VRARYDVLIVGGGPAGLSAALVLGRCRRKVLVVDAGRPRNARSPAVHGFFTRDGTPPGELLAIGRAQLAPYDVDVVEDAIVGVSREGRGFSAVTASGAEIRARKLLVATGMRDVMPDAPGFSELLGRFVFVCPYCDGWERRDRRLCAYARGEDAVDVGLGLTTWSADVALVIPDRPIAPAERDTLRRNGVDLYEETVERLDLDGDALVLTLASGRRLRRDAVFVHFGEVQASSLAERLGCPFEDNGTVAAGEGETAGPPGVFVAGDASHDRQLLPVAIAEGVKAACAINVELRREDQR